MVVTNTAHSWTHCKNDSLFSQRPKNLGRILADKDELNKFVMTGLAIDLLSIDWDLYDWDLLKVTRYELCCSHSAFLGFYTGVTLIKFVELQSPSASE